MHDELTQLENILPGIAACVSLDHIKSVEVVPGECIFRSSQGYLGDLKKTISQLGLDESYEYLSMVSSGKFELVEELEEVADALYSINADGSIQATNMPNDSVSTYNIVHENLGWMRIAAGQNLKIYDHPAPIKLLTNKSILGLFTLVDKISHLSSLSRPRESWSIYAGRVSGFRMNTTRYGSGIDRNKRVWNISNFVQDGGRGDNIYFYDFIDQLRKQRLVGNLTNCKNKIALIPVNMDKILTDDCVQLNILKKAWVDAYQYRAASNSFNQTANVPIVKELNPGVNIFTSKSTSGNSLLKRGGSLLKPTFVDTILDVLNRPLRGVPCYNFTDSQEQYYADAVANNTEKFFYPLDYHNLHFYRNIHMLSEAENKRKRTITSLPGWAIFGSGVQNEVYLKHKPYVLGFIQDVVDRYVENYSKINSQSLYPWNVTAESCIAEGQHMYYLLFSHKNAE